MSLTYSIQMPQGYVQELRGIPDPIEAYETLTSVAQTAEEYGYTTAWAIDHFQTVPEPTQETFFECWTTAAALARDTKRIRIGQMVTANSYRNPALQAKMASTLDVLSHGRFTFGIGAGYYEPDYRTYGYEFPEGKVRVRQLREAVQIILAMWNEPAPTFEGTYYQIHQAINQPKGVQQPHIPLVIAGFGERLLKVVAESANICNTGGDPATVEQKFAVLKKHCETVGRDYESIKRTTVVPVAIGETDEKARALWLSDVIPPYTGDVFSYGLIGSIDTIRQRIAAYEAAGVQELVLWFVDATKLESVRRFAREFIQ
ncbi:LLM class F420-dependent oxidoreductase [Reticulibacter mediterranei]|uniref:LLM class F420-dependent oxidoreductase n=1 Tax=Reticulibacter mediterranei TaxID=2778369 RepID=A0A8J3IDP3_9CHLR|nr:TIGR03560 family F420-dependent LLM class oxidoreductase [Reticulibacter mediterranei]GHO90545.1 LLM class F420-dependent oxidoreductase [Reticulibacter mediterranei]